MKTMSVLLVGAVAGVLACSSDGGGDGDGTAGAAGSGATGGTAGTSGGGTSAGGATATGGGGGTSAGGATATGGAAGSAMGGASGGGMGGRAGAAGAGGASGSGGSGGAQMCGMQFNCTGLPPVDIADFFTTFAGTYDITITRDCTTGVFSVRTGQTYQLTVEASTQTATVTNDNADFALSWDCANDDESCTLANPGQFLVIARDGGIMGRTIELSTFNNVLTLATVRDGLSPPTGCQMDVQ